MVRAELGDEAATLYVGQGSRPTSKVPFAAALVGSAELAPFILALVLAESLAVAFGVDPSTMHPIRELSLVGAAAGSLMCVRFLHGRARRLSVHRLALIGGGTALVITGVSTTLPVVVGALTFAAALLGCARTARHALLGDVGPPMVRPRCLLVDRSASVFGMAGVATLAWWQPGGWRGVVLLVGLVTLVCGAVISWGRDPGYGEDDAAAVRRLVNDRAGAEVEVGEVLRLSLGESIRQILSTPALRLVALGVFAIGSTVGPALVFTMGVLQEHHHVPAGRRAATLAIAGALAGLSALATSRLIPSLRRELAVIIVPGAALVLAGVAPTRGAATVALAVALSGLMVAEARLLAAGLASVEPMLRPHAVGIFSAAWFVGAAQALQFTGSIESRYGPRTGLVVLGASLVPMAGVMSAVRSRSTERLPTLAGEVVEDQQLRVLVASGADVPLLACRHIDFGYGGLQVLFDVSFTVGAGEMVALLGTNGAGKSTLLRAISGLGRPTAGALRYDGHDITGLDAPRRVAAGIVQVPGGKARFPTMTVADNLRAYGHVLGRDRRLLDARIDDVFGAFPRLGERRGEIAATLSGGEAQMLALGKALLLRPRLLLIDELSLGLAPKVVGDLLDMVKAINATGTAVVLVEQSVNIALSLVDHAYFMEKGRIRFDGGASSLLGRDDLLRSVFLEGAGSVG